MKNNIMGTLVVGLLFLGLTESGASSLDYGNVNSLSQAEQLATIKQGYSAIKYITNPAKEIQLAAIHESYHAIKLIKNPSKEVQLAAVKESYQAIEFIKNPSKEVQLAAVNQRFDDWCVQFDTFEDASVIAQSLEQRESINIVEITLLSYPQYFFPNLQGNIHATRQVNDKIICIVEPFMGSNFRLAICDINTKHVRLTNTRYKNVLSVEGAFAHYEE